MTARFTENFVKGCNQWFYEWLVFYKRMTSVLLCITLCNVAYDQRMFIVQDDELSL